MKPQRVRFFRGQMQTIITKALTDLDIKAVPSRRCFALIGLQLPAYLIALALPSTFKQAAGNDKSRADRRTGHLMFCRGQTNPSALRSLLGTCAGLLEERIESVYMQAPGYSEKATTLFTLDLGSPQDLPDALRGESWVFVQLPLEQLVEETRAVESRQTFGSVFSLDAAGLADLPSNTMIPGGFPTMRVYHPPQLLLAIQHSRKLHLLPSLLLIARPPPESQGRLSEHYSWQCRHDHGKGDCMNSLHYLLCRSGSVQ